MFSFIASAWKSQNNVSQDTLQQALVNRKPHFAAQCCSVHLVSTSIRRLLITNKYSLYLSVQGCMKKYSRILMGFFEVSLNFLSQSLDGHWRFRVFSTGICRSVLRIIILSDVFTYVSAKLFEAFLNMITISVPI